MKPHAAAHRKLPQFHWLNTTLLLFASLTGLVFAQETVWIGPEGGLWSDAANWSTGHIPKDGQDAVVTQSGITDRTVIYQLRQPLGGTFRSMLLEGTGGGAMTLQQSGGRADTLSLLYSVDEVVGGTGTGVYQQGGGINFLNGGQPFNDYAGGSLVLGQGATGHGIYTLSGTTGILVVNADPTSQLVVGDAGTGDFHQTGGAAWTNRTVLGRQATGSGTFTLSNSSGTPYPDASIPSLDDFRNVLHTDDALPATGFHQTNVLLVGEAGRGDFVQTGGINVVTSALALGGGAGADAAVADAHSSGTYELSGDGRLVVGADTFVGLVGRGTFTQTGGSHTVGGFLNLGSGAGATGAYALVDGTVSVTGGMKVGDDGTGSLVQSDGGLTVGGTTFVGRNGAGSIEQTGGTSQSKWLYLAGDFDEVGHPTGASSTGSYSLGGDAALNVTWSETIGVAGNATFTQTGGTNTSSDMTIGYAGAGSYVQDGGINTVAAVLVHNKLQTGFGWMVLGDLPGSSGDYQLNAGTLDISGAMRVGFDGQGSFTQTGGSVQAGAIDVGSTSGPSSYTITAGEIQAGALNIGIGGNANGRINYGGYARFNQSGGTVTIQGLELGQPGTSGVADIPTYKLSGGTLNLENIAYIGGVFNNDLGLPGIFEQSGGIVQGTGDFSRIYVDGPDSRYDLSGGEIHSDGFVSFVGAQINQTGGTVYGVVGAAGATYNLSGSDSRIVASGLGVQARTTTGTDDVLPGFFNQSDGNVTVTDTNDYGWTLGVFGGGTYNLSGTGRVTVNGNEYVGGFYSTDPDSTEAPPPSLFNQTGGAHRVNGTMTIAGDQPLFGDIVATSSAGTYHLAGGSLSADVIDNRGSFNFSGGSLQAGQFANSGTLTLSGPGTRTVDGAVTNTGTVVADHTTAVFTGTFTNNGAYVSDPSTNVFTNLAVGSTGYLVGGTGDSFLVSGDFTNASTENLFWNTHLADLSITGDGSHLFSLAGQDLGATLDGYANNFAWGGFFLGAGVGLDVTDGNDLFGAAFYTGIFALGGGFGQLGMIHSDFNIYYDPFLSGNAWLGDGTYDLDGSGRLIPIARAAATPDSGSTLALTGLALAGFALLRQRATGIGFLPAGSTRQRRS